MLCLNCYNRYVVSVTGNSRIGGKNRRHYFLTERTQITVIPLPRLQSMRTYRPGEMSLKEHAKVVLPSWLVTFWQETAFHPHVCRPGA